MKGVSSLWGALLIVFAGSSLRANEVEVVRPEFVNELDVELANPPASQSSSVAIYSGNVDTTNTAPAGSLTNGTAVLLLESAFGQSLATDIPYPGFELHSITNAQAMLYPGSRMTRADVLNSDLVFRYKLLLFAGASNNIAADPSQMPEHFGAAERTKFNAAVELMRHALKYAPYHHDLRNTLLDAYYDLAVAEAQFVKSDLAQIAEYRLGFQLVPSDGFVIDKEIELTTNALGRFERAFRQYSGLLTDRMGVNVAEYDPNALAGLPLGAYILQQEQPFRNQMAAEYYDTDGVRRTVPKFNPVLGETVDEPNRILFAGYKDYVLLAGLFRDYATQAAELARLYGMRQHRTPQSDDLQSAYELIRTVQQQVHLAVTLLRGMFPDYQPGPSDASGLAAALHGVGVALADLDSVRAFLDGNANLLGFDPNFLVLIKEAPDGTNDRFDSYDALMYWIGVRPPASDFTPLGYAHTAFDAAVASYDNYQGKADQVWEQLDSIADTYSDRYYEITGWEPGDATTNHILAPRPGSELWQANQTITLSDARVANLKRQSTNLATTVTLANEVVTLATTKSNRLDNAKQAYFDSTKNAWTEMHTWAGSMAAAQATYDMTSDIAGVDGITTTFTGGATAAAIGVAGAINIAVQTAGATRTSMCEQQLEQCAANYDVAQMKLDIPAEIAQAQMESQDRLREQAALTLECEDAVATQAQEVARKAALLRELERIKQQAEENDADLADRYYADPIHFLRAQNDMIRADQAFRAAQQWIFFALRALEYKWNKDFVISHLGKDWQLASLFKLRNYDELHDLVLAMEEFNRVNLSDFVRESNPDVISLRDDVLAPAAGGTDGLWLDVATHERVSRTILFRRKLQRMVDAEGHLVIPLNTFALKKETGFFFLGPRYRTNGTVLSAGKYLDKIDWIKFNVVGSHPSALRDANLSYGGTCYIRTRIPPCGDPANPFALAGEYRAFPFYYFLTTDNGATWETRKTQEDTVKVVFSNSPGEPANPAAANHFLKERSVAATGWVLTLPAGTFNLNQMDDIEIHVSHLFVSRTTPVCP